MSPPALEVVSLTKSFVGPRPWRTALRHPFARRRIQALAEVTLRAEAGELLALVGPNGAGKTTLLKVLCTLVAPDAGSVQVAGVDALSDSLAARRKVGLVTADERSFYWRLSGRHNLEFFAALQNLGGKEARRRVVELLERVDLAASADAPFREYSTGMRQKLALCRGMLHRPPVLLLDEPTRGIDLATLRVLRTLLKEHVASGGGALLASHDLGEIEALDCRVALLRQGRVEGAGTVAELRQKLGITEEVALACEGAEGWAGKLAGHALVTKAFAEKDWLVVTLAPGAAVGELVALLQNAGTRVTAVRRRGAGLEAVVDAAGAVP